MHRVEVSRWPSMPTIDPPGIGRRIDGGAPPGPRVNWPRTCASPCRRWPRRGCLGRVQVHPLHYAAPRRSSSVVEQGTHKPLVTGSNPVSATNDLTTARAALGPSHLPATMDRPAWPGRRPSGPSAPPNIRASRRSLVRTRRVAQLRDRLALRPALRACPTVQAGRSSGVYCLGRPARTGRHIRRLRYTLNRGFLRNGIVMARPRCGHRPAALHPDPAEPAQHQGLLGLPVGRSVGQRHQGRPAGHDADRYRRRTVRPTPSSRILRGRRIRRNPDLAEGRRHHDPGELLRSPSRPTRAGSSFCSRRCSRSW